jgi:hypothetical protein
VPQEEKIFLTLLLFFEAHQHRFVQRFSGFTLQWRSLRVAPFPLQSGLFFRLFDRRGAEAWLGTFTVSLLADF